MFSDFKFIDCNLSKDITKGPDSTARCIWFTVPICVHSEVDDDTGEEKSVYEYFSFPCTARDGVEEDYIPFSAEGPYVYNISQFMLNF